MMQWSRLKVTTPRAHAEACAQLLWDAGCQGVEIEDAAFAFDESEDATLVDKEESLVIGYLASQDEAEQAGEMMFDALQRGQIEATLQAEPVPEEDWSSSWKQHFPPLRIGPFLVAPSWEEVEAEPGVHLLRLDPGLAFGTGQHPTTRMCLELVGEWLQAAPPQPVVFDVGCGSGILSVAAATMGAVVTASDLDPQCVEATRENARQNGVEIEVVEEAGASWSGRQFDLVVANLMSDLLIQLAPQLAGATKPDGTLIVSGISTPRAREVQAALEAAGFQTRHHREMDGDRRGDFVEQWTAFEMQRKASNS